MGLIRKVGDHALELVKRFCRTPLAIIRYRHVSIAPGVVIGPNCELGEDVKIYKNTVLANTKIDDFSYVGGDSRLQNCRIGKFCSIGPEVRIGLGVHPTQRISTYPGFYSSSASVAIRIGMDENVEEFRAVEIGNDVWIGLRAVIMDGVQIGCGSIVAAGSVVTKDVEPYSIVGGVPAKIIKKRFEPSEIQALLELKWWDKGLDFCVSNANLFNNPSAFFLKYGGKTNANEPDE